MRYLSGAVTVENKNILKNDPESIKYRRNQNTLVVLGTGVILFGFWGIVKIIAQILLGFQLFEPGTLDDLDAGGIVFVIFFVALVLSTDVILRLYAGLRARREGHGKKTGVGHLIVLVLLIAGSVASVVIIIFNIMSASGDLADNIAALFVELSSLVISLEVFMASVSVRHYRKKNAAEGM